MESNHPSGGLPRPAGFEGLVRSPTSSTAGSGGAASRTVSGSDPHGETPASRIPGALVAREPSAMMLTRSESDRVIAGIAGGIAQRFGLSSTLVRVAWVFSILFGGFGVLAYVILWVVLPKRLSGQMPAIRVAEERYARGEIGAEEFTRIRSDLQVSR
jgi:phage shock protein C